LANHHFPPIDSHLPRRKATTLWIAPDFSSDARCGDDHDPTG
jgi:hypothetical protein